LTKLLSPPVNRYFFGLDVINLAINIEVKKIADKTPLIITPITSHPSNPHNLNSFFGISGGNGLQDFGQS
jgi:hypothetical protein